MRDPRTAEHTIGDSTVVHCRRMYDSIVRASRAEKSEGAFRTHARSRTRVKYPTVGGIVQKPEHHRAVEQVRVFTATASHTIVCVSVCVCEENDVNIYGSLSITTSKP